LVEVTNSVVFAQAKKEGFIIIYYLFIIRRSGALQDLRKACNQLSRFG
jgi:glycerol-3-phosphate responsive antiterminator